MLDGGNRAGQHMSSLPAKAHSLITQTWKQYKQHTRTVHCCLIEHYTQQAVLLQAKNQRERKRLIKHNHILLVWLLNWSQIKEAFSLLSRSV